MDGQAQLPAFERAINHPARYSVGMLGIFRSYIRPGDWVLDPFGGVGGTDGLKAVGARVVVHELEFGVVTHARGARRVCGNAMELPFADDSFDVVCTSPTYGNRMADTFTDGSKRNTYTAGFGFELHACNTGAMQWGEVYRRCHVEAWQECLRVLKPKGVLLLNISDHIRDGVRQYVSRWHLVTLQTLGFRFRRAHVCKTPRNRFGANSELRTAAEYIFVMEVRKNANT